MTPTPLAATTESGRVRYGGRGRARRCSRRGSHSCRGHRRGTSSESTKTPVEQVRSVDAAPTEVPPPTPASHTGEPTQGRVIPYEEASEIVETAQNLPHNQHETGRSHRPLAEALQVRR